MKLSEKWFCIGQSGATSDGRTIEAEDLQQAAESYNPETFTAVLNIEHYRPYFPKSDLGGLGHVLELRAETKDNTTKLYARIDPTDKTIELINSREKVFTSMELQRNFAQTGKAYLVGLALTDSPASLGTSMLKFTAENQEIISNYAEMTEKMSEKQTLWQKIHAAMFAQNSEQPSEQPKPSETPKDTPPANPAPEGKNDERGDYAQMAEVIKQLVDDNKASAQAFAALQKEFAEFKQKVETAAVNGQDLHLGAITAADSEF